MGPWSRVRVAKCQMLVTCFFILLLGLSVATMVTLTYFGAHFAVIRRASLEKNPYQAVHQWAFSAGLSLVGLLTLGAVLSAAGTVREAQGLMAGGFLCFSLAFCAQVQVMFWRLHSPTQVEDAMLDTYDLVYEQAMKGTSHVRRQELAAIQDTFLCCGKRSPFSRLGSTEADLCQGQEAAREDCLQGIRSILRIHQQVTSSLTSIGLALTVSALLLSSFLWFAVRSGCSLDRKGRYTLAPRACGHQPQEPSLFRRSQGGPARCLCSEADAIGPRRYSGSLRWLQDNDAAPGPLSRHLPAHRGEDAPAVSPHGIPEGRDRVVRRGGSEGPAREPGSTGNRRKGRGSSPNPSMGTGQVQAQRKPRWRQQPRADLQTPVVHALEGSTQTQAATVFYAA
ncbi:tetraspanin-32 isoform X5 [Chlorocebus sabaeus]|uniref:tetraspanin-32 isoform X5 n=3 Tax=Chlorocebus sabaeus TaxID=60711 RepID=UPI0018B0285D|nr:tetraspanin-32 isoform X4 [Chlorocebus sabaeus]